MLNSEDYKIRYRQGNFLTNKKTNSNNAYVYAANRIHLQSIIETYDHRFIFLKNDVTQSQLQRCNGSH